MAQTVRHTTMAFAAAFMLLSSGIAHAQFGLQPFSSKEGINTATASAKGSLGGDAILIYLAAPGDFEYQGAKAEFDLTNGDGTAWLYSFYSPSTKKGASVAVIRPAGIFVPIPFGDTAAVPIPTEPQALNNKDPFFDSKNMVTRLSSDTAYMRFRSELPGARPKLVTLGDLFALDSLQTPNSFPIDQALWTLLFRGEGDSTMLCFVAARTGEVSCQRIELPTLSVPSTTVGGTAALDVSPNPADGHVRVSITLPQRVAVATGVGLGLYNERGEHVLDLTASLAENDYRYAEFDSRTLPAGVYYCRAIGSNWNGIVGVVVER